MHPVCCLPHLVSPEAFGDTSLLMFLCPKQNLSTEEQKNRFIRSRHAVGFIARRLHGFSRILFFLPHTDHTNLTEAASQGVLAACRLHRVYTPRRTHTSEARYALCSLRSLCETNIHHSVRKKQSKFCLNSVDKNRFVTIPVGKSNHAVGFIARRLHGFSRILFFYSTQITRIAQRLRRKECLQRGGCAECTRLVGFQ